MRLGAGVRFGGGAASLLGYSRPLWGGREAVVALLAIACPVPAAHAVAGCPAEPAGTWGVAGAEGPAAWAGEAVVDTGVATACPQVDPAQFNVPPAPYDPSGIREFLVDFATERHSTTLSLDAFPNALSFSRTEAYARGPVAPGDVSQGLLSFAWRARYAAGSVLLGRADGGAEAVLFAIEGPAITWLGLAFEGSGRAVVAAERATSAGGGPEIWIYHFDAVADAFVWESFGFGRCPAAILDDDNSADGDVQVFYVDSADAVMHRQQRNRYNTAFATPLVLAEGGRIGTVVRVEGTRLALFCYEPDPVTGRWTEKRLDSEIFPYTGREGFSLTATALAGLLYEIATMPREGITLTSEAIGGLLRETIQVHTGREGIALHSSPTAGVLLEVVKLYEAREPITLNATPVSGSMPTVVIVYAAREPITLSSSPTGGTLVTV